MQNYTNKASIEDRIHQKVNRQTILKAHLLSKDSTL